MKIIIIEHGEGVPTTIKEEDYDESEGCGTATLGGIVYPSCFCCLGSTETMVRLVDIDDGFLNDYLCSDCIKKIAIMLEK